MEMKKGIIFSTDAALALSITIVLFSAITLTSLGGSKEGTQQAILYTKASDKALVAFYQNDTGADTTPPEALKANCSEIKKYGNNGALADGVKKCEKLG
ncbi:MAG: hypothetical protein AABW99_00460 [archaeon]